MDTLRKKGWGEHCMNSSRVNPVFFFFCNGVDILEKEITRDSQKFNLGQNTSLLQTYPLTER